MLDKYFYNPYKNSDEYDEYDSYNEYDAYNAYDAYNNICNPSTINSARSEEIVTENIDILSNTFDNLTAHDFKICIFFQVLLLATNIYLLFKYST